MYLMRHADKGDEATITHALNDKAFTSEEAKKLIERLIPKYAVELRRHARENIAEKIRDLDEKSFAVFCGLILEAWGKGFSTFPMKEVSHICDELIPLCYVMCLTNGAGKRRKDK